MIHLCSAIADRRAGRLRAAFKDNHSASAHRQVVSVRQSYYAGADNRVIEFHLRHIDVCCA
jgi:hypothetical protein